MINNGIETATCSVCGTAIDEQEALCETCANLNATEQIDLQLHNLDSKLVSIIVDLNLGWYALNDDDCIMLMGRLRGASAVLRDTRDYLKVIENTVKEEKEEKWQK